MGWLGCTLTVLETTLSYASIMGLKTDLRLDPDGDEYQWLGSLFYFGELFPFLIMFGCRTNPE